MIMSINLFTAVKYAILTLIISTGTALSCNGQNIQDSIEERYIVPVNSSHKLEYLNTEETNYLKKQNTDLGKKIQQQSSQIQELTNAINLNKPGVLELWIYPIILSIVAAIIFWFAFSYIPEYKRNKELRPKIEAELDALKFQLFLFIDKPLWVSEHYGSLVQHKIKANTLTHEEIKFALYNKCLNKKYLYDSVVASKLIIIGESLYESTKKIDQQIEHLFSFNILLTSKEILLLENIRKTTQRHDLAVQAFKNPVASVAGQLLAPAVTSITNMHESFYKCLILHAELQGILHKTPYGKAKLGHEIVHKLFYQGNYRECKRQITKFFKDDPKNQVFWILSELFSGNKSEAYILLEARLKKSEIFDIVSDRTVYKPFLNDEKGLAIITELSKPDEFQRLLTTIQEEDFMMSQFQKDCLFIKKYYEWKVNNYQIGKIYDPNENVS